MPENESKTHIDLIVRQAVFGNAEEQSISRKQIRDLALEADIYPASIQGFYEARGRSLFKGMTVPAINIRGITYDVARAVFKAAIMNNVGAFIFEIARSEIGYTGQRPAEFAACVLAAAIREGFKGPVFLQGDHFQVSQKRYSLDPEGEIEAVKQLIREAASSGFLNIDIDASTLVDLKQNTLIDQQEANYRVTAEMTKFIRNIEPADQTISIGGEIGEVGKKNSTIEDLQAFMTGYLSLLGESKGISKISVQTGTTHGGIVQPDGSIAQVNIDFKALGELSTAARELYGMAGAVQHGASTLPQSLFDMFPKTECIEIHLATDFQNIIYNSPSFPAELRDRIYKYLRDNYSNEKLAVDTDEQFIYKTRKKAFGDFKKELWGLPEENLEKLRETFEHRFTSLFKKLNVSNTVELVNKYVVTQETKAI